MSSKKLLVKYQQPVLEVHRGIEVFYLWSVFLLHKPYRCYVEVLTSKRAAASLTDLNSLITLSLVTSIITRWLRVREGTESWISTVDLAARDFSMFLFCTNSSWLQSFRERYGCLFFDTNLFSIVKSHLSWQAKRVLLYDFNGKRIWGVHAVALFYEGISKHLYFEKQRCLYSL